MSSKGPSPDVEPGGGAPHEPAPEPAAIRLQLERLLSSAPIRGSQRCRALLQYVIEVYLEGAVEKLKERVIGHEVFGREADYDTNQDSVVRTAAAEVRKRLAQYYLEPGHEGEIRVLLPAGSYLPEFRLPAPAPATPAHETAGPRSRSWRWAAVAAAAVLVCAAGYWLLRPASEMDRFWEPLLSDREPAVLCIGQPSRIYSLEGPHSEEWHERIAGSANGAPAAESVRRETPLTLMDLRAVGSRFLYFGDAMASMRIAEWLGKKNKPFLVLGDRATSYVDLRGRPAVLIGQFNNRWTMGLTGGLRYYVERNEQDHNYEVRDRQAGGRAIAAVTRSANRLEECVIVSRVVDPSTEKTVIAVAGMTFTGTLAGGDFLTNPAYMRAVFQNAPKDWYRKNIQVVLKTAVVGGAAGPPRQIVSWFW